jgi:hypothetical protein
MEKTIKTMIADYIRYVDVDIMPQWCEIMTRIIRATQCKNTCIAITADNYLGTITDVGDDERIRFNMDSYKWYDATLKFWKF